MKISATQFKITYLPHPIRTLLFSTLFPSCARPAHGIFVETRLRELLKTGEVETKVVAPVPWFPFPRKHFGEYGKFAATPQFERRNGVDVFYPRYFLPPKVGMGVAPYTLAHGAMPTINKLIRDGFDFDLIDAHYYYPDGVAAGIIAKWLGKPFIVTARGTDLNLIPEYRKPRRLILETAKAAAASIGVSQALVDRLAALGAERKKIFFFRNGVDLERFKPEEKWLARQKLGLPDLPTILSVGNLVELKGHHIAIEALRLLPDETNLIIAGSGPEKQKLERRVTELELSHRVRLVGQIPNDELRWLYSAADALALCSSREGCPNVLLESLACGTPVIATNVGGVPEIVSTTTAGRLMESRTPAALATSFFDLMSNYPSQSEIRLFAKNFGWDATSQAQIGLFSRTKNA
jgi:teichuronic acid biosynthesis glycosyltransferase TuaC